jgi:hypothetical protein
MCRYNLYFWIFYLCAARTLDTSMYQDHVDHMWHAKQLMVIVLMQTDKYFEF